MELLLMEKKEIIKDENNLLVEHEDKDVSQIVSNDEMNSIFQKIMVSLSDKEREAMDMYYIFKDYVTNGGEFGAGDVTKEQLANLLKVAQDCDDSKIRLFDSILRIKIKHELNITKNDIMANNIFLGGSRREIIEAIESSQDELDQIVRSDENIKKQIQEIENMIPEKLSYNNEKENINIEIGSGEF
jgi:hypothetical protein